MTDLVRDKIEMPNMLMFVVYWLTVGTQLVCASCMLINTFLAIAGTSATGGALDLAVLLRTI